MVDPQCAGLIGWSQARAPWWALRCLCKPHCQLPPLHSAALPSPPLPSPAGTYALVGTALALQAKLCVLGALGPGRAGAALIAAHAASRWSVLPLVYACTYIQDDEDAKRGLYNWWVAVGVVGVDTSRACTGLLHLHTCRARGMHRRAFF